ncbi:MAG: DUF167 domain-containing protein [Cyanobacteria bacterium SZAS TMP-1]|nr:DUF167 domain-containing protein [Cyanobacteria bacterium SZAS TMP-1]
MQVEPFATCRKEGLLLRLYIQPGAARSAVVGVRREQTGDKEIERLKIALQARAVEGAANQALVAFLAELCGCPKSSISLQSGLTGRSKTVLITGGGNAQLDKLKNLIRD